jgi:hypothetical protein
LLLHASWAGGITAAAAQPHLTDGAQSVLLLLQMAQAIAEAAEWRLLLQWRDACTETGGSAAGHAYAVRVGLSALLLLLWVPAMQSRMQMAHRSEALSAWQEPSATHRLLLNIPAQLYACTCP